MVVAGNHKGATGRVLQVMPRESRAFVEGVNIIHKHQKPSATNQEGGIMKKEAPIHLSNLMVIESKTNEPTRIGRRKNNKGKVVRFSKKTGENID